MREGAGGRRGDCREGMGQVLKGLVRQQGRAWAFAGGRWEPKGLGAEEGWELIQVLTGALLPL